MSDSNWSSHILPCSLLLSSSMEICFEKCLGLSLYFWYVFRVIKFLKFRTFILWNGNFFSNIWIGELNKVMETFGKSPPSAYFDWYYWLLGDIKLGTRGRPSLDYESCWQQLLPIYQKLAGNNKKLLLTNIYVSNIRTKLNFWLIHKTYSLAFIEPSILPTIVLSKLSNSIQSKFTITYEK